MIAVKRCLTGPWRFVATVLWLAGITAGSARGDYTVERLVDGLNRPTYVTQAPGDGTSLYIVEREYPEGQLGRVLKYNLQTQSSSTFLDLSGSIVSDGGVLSMTFHPEFQSNGLFYVVSNDSGTNRLDEYQVVNGAPQFQRRLLQYQNLGHVYHTMNQAHFRPGGNNNELYVTTGDGGTQANESNFNPALIESPTSPYGKLLKVDLSHTFTTPASAPGPDTGVSVVALGIRNPFRSSFDRQTGDFYFGDVGFETVESIDFIPASHFDDPSPPVLDFGWTEREGTIATPEPAVGGPGSSGDIDPIFDYAHGGQPLPHQSLFSGQSVTGGYVYRGPIQEFQNRYFFSDYVNGNVYSGTFDRSTNPALFDGTNLTDVQNHTVDFETHIGSGADIQHVASFGEDNAGNLYIVKFGSGGGLFPPLGTGEIFRILPGNRSDLDFNGDVNLADWSILVDHSYTDLSGLSPAQAHAFGDLDGDGDNDFADFRLFKSDFNTVNGAGAFEREVLGVPEPAGLVLAVAACAAGLFARRRITPCSECRRDDTWNSRM
jgi:hypothetical protein